MNTNLSKERVSKNNSVVSIMQKQISIHMILLIALAILSGGLKYCISDGEDHLSPTEGLGIPVRLFNCSQACKIQ